jgi:hypothetical protein
MHLGGDWRMLTKREIDDLVKKCNWKWAEVNGVKGRLVCGRGNYASVSIFLPCVGRSDKESYIGTGSYGFYWSSVSLSINNITACGLCFHSEYRQIFDYCRRYGLSIHFVQGFSKCE